ncbi:MAG: transglycosylase domain-containing protein [Candidatus Microthrix sp.]|nr:transglycosylase domain-containing protein [Candidatus Microthrix sp.]
MWRTFLSKSGTILRILVTMAVGVAGTVVATRMLAQQVGSTAHLANVPEQPDIILEQLNSRSVVYDADGNELAILRRAEDRELVPLSKMPKQLQEAVVGIEDRNFYQHNGVNIRGTLRALVANTQSGDISQGGSTITQQLVKQSLLGTQQTVERKVKEAALAIRLEKQMPKRPDPRALSQHRLPGQPGVRRAGRLPDVLQQGGRSAAVARDRPAGLDHPQPDEVRPDQEPRHVQVPPGVGGQAAPSAGRDYPRYRGNDQRRTVAHHSHPGAGRGDRESDDRHQLFRRRGEAHADRRPADR